MKAFSPTDAAFEGFRLTREQPRALAIWAAAYLVVQLLFAMLAIALGGRALAELDALYRTANPDPAAELGLIRQLAPLFLAVVPLGVGFQAIWTCAIYRAVLRPEEGGPGFFRFGADELRMILLSVVLFIFSLTGVFIVTLVVVVSADLLGASGSSAAALFGLAIAVAAVAAAVWVLVRLSLAAPMTFHERRLSVFRAWPLSRGCFWRVFSTYFLAFVLGVVILLLMFVIATALVSLLVVATGGSIGDVGQVLNADTTSFARFVSPPSLLSEVLRAIMWTVYYVIVLPPTAVVYRALTDQGPPVWDPGRVA